MEANKLILHSDLNNFYASVECLYRPEIRKFPVAVCGDPELRHGIVLAKNQKAKVLGIKTGEVIHSAKNKYPDLVIVPPDMTLYNKFSRWVHEIYEEYSDFIQDYGCDEAWIDVSDIARDEQDAKIIADEIRNRIKEELCVTCSIGVSFCKIFSKLASDMKKPNATTVISRDNYKELVWNMPADNLLFVNRGTMRILQAAKINTIGELAAAPVELLEKLFGKVGRYIHKYANGDDNSSVAHKDYIEPVKSIGNNETTYRDMINIDDVWRVIYMLSESVALRLRQQRMKCRTVKIYIREFDLQFCDRQGKLERPSYLAKDIADKAIDIFNARYKFTKPLRTLGVRGCDLVPDDIGIQINLFDDFEQDEKREVLEQAIDNIRYRFGCDSIQRGVVLMDRKLTHIPSDYNRSSYRVGSFNNA